MLEKLLEWDRQAFTYLNSLGTDSHDFFWLAVTDFKTWIPLFLTIGLLLFVKFGLKEGFWMLLSYCSMLILLSITIASVKNLVGRLRPNNDETLNQLIHIGTNPADFSFFSGHAATSFGIAALAVLFLRNRFKWIHVIWLYPLLFSFSRIYLGVHFPVDIVVGWMVGLLFAWLFYRMHQKFTAPYIM